MLRFYATSLFYLLAVLASSLIGETFTQILLLAIATTLAYLLLVFWGVANIRSQMFLKTYHSNSSAKHLIALTYDDGPHAEHTSKLVALLKEHQIKATFFLIGKNIKKYPELVQKMIDEGHQIGNHSYSHKVNFPLFKAKNIKDEILNTQLEIEKFQKQALIYFRPPFGVTNPLIARAIKKLNIKVIGWDIRSFDTMNNEKERILKRVKKKITGGNIILLHDYSEHVVWLTQEIIRFARQNKLEFVTVEELLNYEKV